MLEETFIEKSRNKILNELSTSIINIKLINFEITHFMLKATFLTVGDEPAIYRSFCDLSNTDLDITIDKFTYTKTF